MAPTKKAKAPVSDDVREAMKASEKALQRESAGRLSTLEQRMNAIKRRPIERER